jgi:Malectin domain/IPT/TIG domain
MLHGYPTTHRANTSGSYIIQLGAARVRCERGIVTLLTFAAMQAREMSQSSLFRRLASFFAYLALICVSVSCSCSNLASGCREFVANDDGGPLLKASFPQNLQSSTGRDKSFGIWDGSHSQRSVSASANKRHQVRSFDPSRVALVVESSNQTAQPPPNSMTAATHAPLAHNFEKIFINAGGEAVRDIFANDWDADTYFVGGVTFNDSTAEVDGTRNDLIYQSQRVGTFDYDIPVPEGNYELILHFAELDLNATEGDNVFHIEVEKSQVFPMVDIVSLIGSPRKPLTLETAIVVVDGNLSLSFRSVHGLPTLSAIEIDLVGDHLAHADAGGPYEEVDVDNDGFASVLLDGSLSHTHGIGLELIAWHWYEQGALVAIGETTTLSLPVGEHDIVLKVLDSGGNQHAEVVTITVYASGYPVVTALSPNSGDLLGGTMILIEGSGYHFPIEQTTVRFGAFNISSSDIVITNTSQIQILAVPPSSLGIPVSVSVITPAGESNQVLYTYVDRVPIKFLAKVRDRLTTKRSSLPCYLFSSSSTSRSLRL